jgi:predicted DNA-binding protein (MmcQ/YjbR family)
MPESCAFGSSRLARRPLTFNVRRRTEGITVIIQTSKEDIWLARVSKVCLALPEVTQELRGDHADFRVRKKVFAYFLNNHHGDGIVSVCVKSELGENEDRAKTHPGRYYLPAYIGKRGWFGMYLNRGPIDWKEVQNIIEASYRLAAPKTLVARIPS